LPYIRLIYSLLIGAEGAQTPAGVRDRGDPAGARAEGIPESPAESEAPGAEINRPISRNNDLL
jgi:hypothetical protein